MSEKFVSIVINEEQLNSLIKEYGSYSIDNNGEYIVFFANYNGIIITAYKNNKNNLYKVTFNGGNIEKEALKFSNDLFYPKKKNVVKTSYNLKDNQLGSDEVGTGDLFGPICVCAAYVKKDDIEYFKNLGINDSKKLTDDFILDVVPTLLSKVTYSQLSIPNEKYNEVIAKGLNMNEIKAILHNTALNNVLTKIKGDVTVIIDQFCEKEKYFEYVKNEKVKVNIDIFETKAESKYLCVALASMLARYSFLKKIESLNNKYNVNIPLGAGIKAEEFAKEFIDKYGVEEFKKISKANFKNIKRILD